MADNKGIVHIDKLNVRMRPAADAPALCQLMRNTAVTYSEATAGWLGIDFSLLEGYVSRAYMQLHTLEPPGPTRMESGIVEAEALNLRSGPGYDFSTVAVINRGTLVEILGEMDDWLQVRTRPVRGFIMRDLIVEIIGGGDSDAEAYPAAVNEKNVNLRSGPGDNYAVLSILARDTQLRVFRVTAGWAEVETLVQQGYLRKEFIKRSTGETIPTSGSDATAVATVATDGLALRNGPSESSAVLALLTSGLQFRVLDMAGGWLRVRPLIKSAYVASQYILDTGAVTPLPSPISADTLQPPPNEIIPIESHFSTEQRNMAEAWNQYGGLIKKVSVEFSLKSVVSLAVLCVESGGKGFGPDGRMIIRFENHYFFNYWGVNNPELYARHFRFSTDKPWQGHEYRPTTTAAWQPVHTGQQASEWQVFEFASRLNRNAALMSISMGSPQIMGANYAILCYSAVEEMFFAFQSDIRNQIRGLFRYIQGKNLTPLLVAEDFVAFARVYNGPANATAYGNKLKKHVDEFRKIFEFE